MWSRQISSSSGEGIVLDFRSGFKRLSKIQLKKLGLSAADCLRLRCLSICLYFHFSHSLSPMYLPLCCISMTDRNCVFACKHILTQSLWCVRVFVLSGCSRGPSPLTMGAQDTLPVAAAFTETVSAYFKGADPNKYDTMSQNQIHI